MFADFDTVLEIGCADAFCSRIVAQAVKNLTVTDFDPIFIEDAQNKKIKKIPYECYVHNILDASLDLNFNGVFALDVLEHISRDEEKTFMQNLTKSMHFNGSAIIGMPSLNSQKYASTASKDGHVNCKSFEEFKSLCKEYFYNVFIFSMNDEVVHTGFHQMANYFLAIGCNLKNDKESI